MLYFGLIDKKISTSEKDLPVKKRLNDFDPLSSIT